nr:hypothetical protein [Tanacetum cinerariifolium]
RTRFTTPTGGYEVGESSVAAAAKQIRPALTIDDSRRVDDMLIGRLKRERRYFRTLSTTYTQEVEALHRDVSTLQGQQIDDEDRLTRHIQYEHAQRDAAPEDGDSFSQEVADATPWKTLRQMMTMKYCPRGEVKKLEVELWNLKDLEKRNHTEEPNLCSLNATSTMMDHVVPNAPTRATTTYQGVPTCFEGGAQGHFKNNFPKLGNKNQGNRNQENQNQVENGNAVARAYRVGTAGGNPNANVMTGTL